DAPASATRVVDAARASEPGRAEHDKVGCGIARRRFAEIACASILAVVRGEAGLLDSAHRVLLAPCMITVACPERGLRGGERAMERGRLRALVGREIAVARAHR